MKTFALHELHVHLYEEEERFFDTARERFLVWFAHSPCLATTLKEHARAPQLYKRGAKTKAGCQSQQRVEWTLF